MQNCNAKPLAGTRHRLVELHTSMDAFDRLPVTVRRALANASMPFSSEGAVNYCRTIGAKGTLLRLAKADAEARAAWRAEQEALARRKGED